MERNGILAAGNWVLDKLFQLDRWPDQGELANMHFLGVSAGGGPCNVLADLAALPASFPLYAMGIVGKDADGQFFLDFMKKRGVNTDFLHAVPEAPTSHSLVLSTASQRTFFHDHGANALLDYPDFEKADCNARLFYLGYLLLLDKLDLPDPEYGTVAARVLALMQSRGMLTLVDCVSETPEKIRKTVSPSLKYSDYVVFNDLESSAAAGIPLRDEAGNLLKANLSPCARALLAKGPIRLVVIHYPEGAFAVTADGIEYEQGSCILDPAGIKGTVGAGDAFCAGILYGLHESMPVPDMLKFAVCSAAFNLQSATACEGAPDMKSLQAFCAAAEFRTC